MGMIINDKGYVCYIRSGVAMSDTHGGGGREQLHKLEFEEICNEIVDKKIDRAMVAIEKGIQEAVNAYGSQVWKELVTSLKDVLQEDIVSEVKIGFDNAKEIFYGSKAQEYIRRNIENAIYKELNKLSKRTIEFR